LAAERRYRSMPGAYTAMSDEDSGYVRYPIITPERPPLLGTQSDPRPMRTAGTSSLTSNHEARSISLPRAMRASNRTLSTDQTLGSPIKERLAKRPRRVRRPGRANPGNLAQTSDGEVVETSNASPAPEPSANAPEECPAVPSRVPSPNPGQRRLTESRPSPRYVHEKLRAMVHKTVTPSRELGCVYIIRNDDSPHHLKIGSARTLRFLARKKEIEDTCKITCTTIYVSADFQYYERAERLIHRDLIPFNQTYDCLGRCRPHTEWFDVDARRAKETADRWVEFISKQQPYDTAGELNAFWVQLLSKKEFNFEQPTSQEELHRLRWHHWGDILQPTLYDYLMGRIRSVQRYPPVRSAVKFSWQISCVVSLSIIFHTFQDRISCAAFVISMVCAWHSATSQSEQGKPPQSRRR
jgi:hypothetical protein